MRNRDLTVGLFLIGGIILFALGIFLIGNQHRAFSRHFEVYAEFANLSGLMKGAKIQVAGLGAGEITDISIPSSPAAKFRVRLRIEERFHPMVRTDSVVTIATEGVVGDKFLLIHPGTAQRPEANSGSTLPSKDNLDMSQLMERSAGLLNQASSTMATTGQKLNGTLDVATTTIRNANDLVLGLKAGKGTAGMLLRDETTATHIRQSVETLHQTVDSLNHTGHQADAMVSDLQSRDLGQKAEDAVSNARNAAENINATSQRIRTTVDASLGPNEQGVDAATSIRQSISNLNQATENMADDTEALKRNFFFRGFFRRRGYYDLTHISASEYRANKLFSDPKNPREWLSASDLFESDGKGTESLSTAGKSRIDALVVGWADSLGASPLIVEGYSTSSTPADRMALARSRAILVREYVRRKFHLEAQSIVIEALADQPPPGTGKNEWDGICILLLSGRN